MDFAETSSTNGEAIILPRSVEEFKKPGRKKELPSNSRFAEPSSSSSYFDGCKNFNVDVEDASLILRKMEVAAFQAIVAAFRTQGPLTPYKELLLEHLRFSLFIREHDFIQIIQEVADDSFLQKTCKTLNKSSSCNSQWRTLAFPAHTPSNAYIRKPTQHSSRLNLITTIGCHNVSVKDLDVATAKLSVLKKEQYIPQQLRRVLLDSELSAGRVDVEPFDITEEELQRDFVDYEKEKAKTAKEREEEERGRNGRSKRGKKRKITTPPFHHQTIRAQARAARESEKNNLKKKDDVPEEDEQLQAEADMMKMIEEQAKAPQEVKAKPPPSPPKPVQKIKPPRKSKEAKIIQIQPPKEPKQSTSFRVPPPVVSATGNSSSRHMVITAFPKPPPPAHIEIIHPTQKHNRSEEQRAMDEDLVLVKAAEAMIEDLENTMEPENGLTSGKKRKTKVDHTPKKRGRKPAESKDNSITCARIAPFWFEGKANDPNKPPRGNPDKKMKKHLNDLKSPATVSNGTEKPATSPPPSQQPRVQPSSTSTPKTAIIPVSSATIVIRPKNPSTSTSPSTNVANVNEVSPAKRMRYSSDTTSQTSAANSAPIPADRIFPVRQPGRPTLFRPPNVVFPRSANVLNNGTTRYAVPFTTQSSGNPTRPYYGNPSFTNRPSSARDRPQLHTFTRPTTSVIRLVTTDLKQDDPTSSAPANGMRACSVEKITISSKEGEHLSNGILCNSEAPLNPQNPPANIQFSASYPLAQSTSTEAQMISIRPHFPLGTNLQTPTMINLQAVAISSKPTSSLYQVVNTPSTSVFMQNMSPQIVQTAVPVMGITVASSSFTTIPAHSSIINVPIRPPAVVSIEKPTIQEKPQNGNDSIEDIPLPENAEESSDLNSSYSSNDSFELPPPPPPPPPMEATVSQESKPSIPRPEVVINGVDPHISASHQLMINKNSNQQPQQLFATPSLPLASDASLLSTNNLPIEESQNSFNVSQQKSSLIENAPSTTNP